MLNFFVAHSTHGYISCVGGDQTQPIRPDNRQACSYCVTRPGKYAQDLPRVLLVVGLAQNLVAQRNDGVGPQDEGLRAFVGDGTGLEVPKRLGLPGRGKPADAFIRLGDRRGHHVEFVSRLSQQLPSPRAGGGEDESGCIRAIRSHNLICRYQRPVPARAVLSLQYRPGKSFSRCGCWSVGAGGECCGIQPCCQNATSISCYRPNPAPQGPV